MSELNLEAVLILLACRLRLDGVITAAQERAFTRRQKAGESAAALVRELELIESRSMN